MTTLSVGPRFELKQKLRIRYYYKIFSTSVKQFISIDTDQNSTFQFAARTANLFYQLLLHKISQRILNRDHYDAKHKMLHRIYPFSLLLWMMRCAHGVRKLIWAAVQQIRNENFRKVSIFHYEFVIHVFHC